MTNNVTGLVALIGAITALVTALGTVIGIVIHIRNHNVQSTSTTQFPSSASEIHPSAENTPFNPKG